MTNQILERTPRLAPGPSEVIERGRTIQFTFNGKTYQAHPGDTIASALYAAGVRTFSRSFKYHRPRSLFCATGHCPNCLVQIGDQPNVRSCVRRVEQGMVVKPQNAWPSLDADVMSMTQMVSRFLPVGFYYKLFLWPKPMWPVYENILRRAAGLGAVDPNAPRHYFDKVYRHTDVLVVGGGRAGLTAALEAARRGARVLVVDENPNLRPAASRPRGIHRGPRPRQPGARSREHRRPDGHGRIRLVRSELGRRGAARGRAGS